MDYYKFKFELLYEYPQRLEEFYFPSPRSTPEAYYAVRRNNLHKLAVHSYTGQQGIFDVVTYMELEEIELGI